MTVITEWDWVYYEVWQELQSVTKGYYKTHQVLQSVTIIAKWDIPPFHPCPVLLRERGVWENFICTLFWEICWDLDV